MGLMLLFSRKISLKAAIMHGAVRPTPSLQQQTCAAHCAVPWCRLRQLSLLPV